MTSKENLKIGKLYYLSEMISFVVYNDLHSNAIKCDTIGIYQKGSTFLLLDYGFRKKKSIYVSLKIITNQGLVGWILNVYPPKIHQVTSNDEIKTWQTVLSH